MKKIAIGALFLALPTSIAAQSTDCITIEDTEARLECYDRAAGVTAAPETTQDTAQTIPAPDNWRLDIQQSAMTDETNVFMTVESDTPVQCSFGGGHLTLTARCFEDTTSVIISGDCHLSSSPYHDWGHVTYRLDDDTPAEWRMDAATNNRALGLWQGRSSIPQIQRMFGKETLRVRLRPFGQNAVETTFNIEGMETIIGPLRRACGW